MSHQLAELAEAALHHHGPGQPVAQAQAVGKLGVLDEQTAGREADALPQRRLKDVLRIDGRVVQLNCF